MFEVPNLDCLTTDPDEMARVADVFAHLSAYAGHRAIAMRHRLETGDVEAALASERCAETIYKRLPDWAKW